MESGATEAAHIIQSAVAPVFLLAGIAGVLNVLSLRLGRVIDRARIVEAEHETAQADKRARIEAELHTLSRRLRFINLAVTLVTICALLVCAVIAGLFLGFFLKIDFASVIGWTFILAMLSLISGLLVFLEEIYLATRSIRFGMTLRDS